MNARHIKWFALVLAVVVALPAMSQDRRGDDRRGGGRRGGRFGGRGAFTMSKAMLIRAEQVQKELKVSAEQKGELDKIVSAYFESFRARRGGRRGGEGGDADRPSREELQKQREKATAEVNAKIDGALKKEQVARLNQIMIQQRGTRALVDKDLVAALKISEEQVGKIKAAIEAGREARSKLFGGSRGRRGGGEGGDRRRGGGDFSEIREKMQKVQKETDGNILAVLTDAQKKAYAKMQGEKFELDRRALFGGRGRFGPGGDRGRRGGGDSDRSRRRRPAGEEEV